MAFRFKFPVIDKKFKKKVKIDQPALAVKENVQTKVFAITEPRKMIEPFRNALVRRGWSETSIEDKTITPSIIWLGRKPNDQVTLYRPTMTNRLKRNPKLDFCFKDILVNIGRNVSKNNQLLTLPRTYKLFENETRDFIADFRLTAFSSFVRFLNKNGLEKFSSAGTVTPYWIDFAIHNLEIAFSFHKKSKNKIHPEVQKQLESISNEFDIFKRSYESVLKHKSKIKVGKGAASDYLTKCKAIWEKCRKVWPHFENDGFYNVWLLKPSRGSLGNGIKIFDDAGKLLTYAKDNQVEKTKYLVQKYIEQPLLIHDTKFHLRQYFVVVHYESRIRLWMYKRSYLEFATKLYDPSSDKPSIHITNTNVQCKYKIDIKRSKNIPESNEWSSDRFLQYLKNNNELESWSTKIYPAMKQNIITLVSATVAVDLFQPNHFQLYGCDFLINDNYEPVLLEINSNPILNSDICANCLEDVAKVIVDAKANPLADTGQFEMIWNKKM